MEYNMQAAKPRGKGLRHVLAGIQGSNSLFSESDSAKCGQSASCQKNTAELPSTSENKTLGAFSFAAGDKNRDSSCQASPVQMEPMPLIRQTARKAAVTYRECNGDTYTSTAQMSDRKRGQERAVGAFNRCVILSGKQYVKLVRNLSEAFPKGQNAILLTCQVSLGLLGEYCATNRAKTEGQI